MTLDIFVADRLSTVPSVATVNKDIRTLKSIFNLAIEPRGYLTEGQNPFAKIRERKMTENEIRYVTVEEYHKLVKAAEKIWWHVLFALAYGSGLRRNEILHLTWADIDFEHQRIKVSAKKGTEDILEWDPKNRITVSIVLSFCQDTIQQFTCCGKVFRPNGEIILPGCCYVRMPRKCLDYLDRQPLSPVGDG